MTTTASWFFGLWFTAGVTFAFGLLVAVARGVAILMSKVAPGFLSFPWRQGLANLHRPNNQTTAVMLAIGLGTFLLVTLYNVRSALMSQVVQRSGKGEPNLVLFDVQQQQRRDIEELVRSFNLGLYAEVPVVTMRLSAVKDRRVEEIRADTSSRIPSWALRREYRSTYRSRLAGTEQIVAGRWQGKVDGDSQPIPVSLETGIAETLRVRVSAIRWNSRFKGFLCELGSPACGKSIGSACSLTSSWCSRRACWRMLRSSMPWWLERESAAASANLQRAVVERFPNVSVIDLTLVLNTLDSILGRVSDAIRIVALFTILTGCAVLASAVLSSRSQRVKESILLRTLGATRRQIVTSVIAEYVFLGLISAVTGALLAILASWALSFYFFKTAAALSVGAVISVPMVVTVITVLAGALGCWGIFRRSALETLRAEA